jgi:2-aminoadipate transaminase
MQLSISRESDAPLYRQIVDQIADLIHHGVLAAGTRLPTIRELASEAGLTRLTVQSAYQELQAQGLIESFVGRGTFVSESLQPRPRSLPHLLPQMPISWTDRGLLADVLSHSGDPNIISFIAAAPDPATFPTREFAAALREAVEDPAALGYGPAQGDVALREQFSRLMLDRGVVAPPDHILVTNGAQHGIDLAFRTLASIGDVILVEEPTYPGAIEVAARHGLRVFGIPLDGGGLDLARLDDACALYHPRVLYVVPTCQNPTGLCYDDGHRQRLIEIARARDLIVIEDDAYGSLSFERTMPLALKSADAEGRVVYVTSVSKMFMPGLRLGAIAAAPVHLTALIRAKQHSDLNSSPLLQRALALYLRRGHLGTHLHQVRARYRERCEATLRALERHLPSCQWTHPQGGLSVWVTLPPGMSEAEVVRGALDRGVGVTRGQFFYAGPQTRGRLRLSYGCLSPEQIERGIAIVGQVIASVARRRDALAERAAREALPLV